MSDLLQHSSGKTDGGNKCQQDDIERRSMSAGDLVAANHGVDAGLQRQLSTRHVSMIALGSSIGMGLWIGSGSSLAKGGPASLFLGYCLAGSVVWCVSHSIGELAVMYPQPSAFVQWTGKFVDPAAAFAVGWSYWFLWVISIANELAAANSLISYWTDVVPIAAWITIFLVVIVAVNVGAVKVFGEIEVVSSTIKFGWIFVIIISMSVLSAGHGAYDRVGFRYWNETPFLNGVKGFLAVLPTCVFAMAGSENCGLVACETANPKKSMPRAVKSIWLRLSLFYLMGALMITINVDPANPSLFGSGNSKVTASPYVIAFTEGGVLPLAHMMNAIVIISVISTGTVAVYAGSRTIVGLSHLHMAPKKAGHTDNTGRPWGALIPTLVCGGALAYINVSESGQNVFSWLSNLTSLFTLFGWGMICLCHIRFRMAWARQGRDTEDIGWRSWIYPYGAWYGVIVCFILIVVQFYLAVWPLDSDPSPTASVETFFANYSSVLLVIALWLVARLYYRGPWLADLGQIDLDAGRRIYDYSTAPKERLSNGILNHVGRFLKGIF